MDLTSDIRNDPPVACDMSAAADTPAERRAEYQRLFAKHLAGRQRTGTGIRFRFAAGPGVEAWVRDLAERERACCPFLRSSVTAVGQEVLWDIAAIDDAAARRILDDFYQFPVASGPRMAGT